MDIKERVEKYKDEYSEKLKKNGKGLLTYRFFQLGFVILAPFLLIYFEQRYELPLSNTIILIIFSVILVAYFQLFILDKKYKKKIEIYEYRVNKLESELFGFENKVGTYKEEKDRDEKLGQALIDVLSFAAKKQIDLNSSDFTVKTLDEIFEEKGLNKLALKSEFENLIINLPMIKIGKWLLLGFFLLGIVIWTGGTIYSDMKVRSISEIAESAKFAINILSKDTSEAAEEFQNKINQANKDFKTELEKVNEINTKIGELEKKIQLKFEEITGGVEGHAKTKISDIDEQFDGVKGHAKTKISDIDGQFDGVKGHAKTKISDIDGQFDSVKGCAKTKISDIDGQFSNVKGYANDAVNNINAEKSRALQIIDINSLKEFKIFKEQIESLKESRGKLNLYNIRKFVDNSILIMFGTIIGILIISIIVNIAFLLKRNATKA